MKKVLSSTLLVLVAAMLALPVYADDAGSGSAGVEKLKSGARNVSTGWVEIMDSTHNEASKGKGVGEQLTGVAVGGVIGVRNTVHRMGAGAIDLLTFWIPKKQPLISPENPRLE